LYTWPIKFMKNWKMADHLLLNPNLALQLPAGRRLYKKIVQWYDFPKITRNLVGIKGGTGTQ